MELLRKYSGLILFAASISVVEVARLTFRDTFGEPEIHEHQHDESDDDIVTVSAPGKVLVAGGYLVLAKENLGITVAGTSRFFSSVRLAPRKYSSTKFNIVVFSPQFHESYLYSYDSSTGDVTILPGEHENGFVAKCLQVVFAFLSAHFGHATFVQHIAQLQSQGALEIKLRADNDFYSQTENLKSRHMPVDIQSLRSLPPFLSCPTVNGEIHVAKTGLGSSATLVTSLVGAILSWFKVVRLRGSRADPASLRIVHNLAQLAHGRAQGKIGSGFDVSAAVYGSQVYHRFSPEPFQCFLDETTPLLPSSIFAAVLDTQQQWDHVVKPFSLPSGMELLLGDVCGGSNSPSMARAVLQWKQAAPEEAGKLWKDLAAANQRLLCAFQQLHQFEQQTSPEEWQQVLHELSRESLSRWAMRSSVTGSPGHGRSSRAAEEVVHCLLDLRRAVVDARSLLKRMGEAAGVEVEPDAQTALCDATQELPGVIAAGVPGAGGHDAIFALVISTDAESSVERLWVSWADSAPGRPQVCPLLLRSARTGNNGGAGIRIETEVPW